MVRQVRAFYRRPWCGATPGKKPALSVHRSDTLFLGNPTNPVTAMSVALSKSERIDIRATPPVKQLLQEATRVAQKNVSVSIHIRHCWRMN